MAVPRTLEAEKGMRIHKGQLPGLVWMPDALSTMGPFAWMVTNLSLLTQLHSGSWMQAVSALHQDTDTREVKWPPRCTAVAMQLGLTGPPRLHHCGPAAPRGLLATLCCCSSPYPAMLMEKTEDKGFLFWERVLIFLLQPTRSWILCTGRFPSSQCLLPPP